MAPIVEAEAVDDAAVLVQPEQPRLRIAGLRARRQRADLGEAEAKLQQARGHAGVLVEAGGHAERIREIQPEHVCREAAVIDRRRRQRKMLQRENRQIMRALGVDRMQQGQRERSKKAIMRKSGEIMCAVAAQRQRKGESRERGRQRAIKMRKSAPPRETS